MIVLDTLEISGYDSQTKTIKLCSGDLSKVPPEWNIDFLLLSTFPGNYIPTSTSVVGALSREGINVRRLAKHKEEDLRKVFFCWYSKPLQEVLEEKKKYPFKRLLCFEPRANQNVSESVGMLFRGLTTTCSIGSDLKVVSSLLKTGDSGHSKSAMLKAMVTSCSHWMAAGLPVKEFSIVIYHKGSASDAEKSNSRLLKDFAELKLVVKEKLEEVQEEVDKYSHDFYFSYSKSEKSWVDVFEKSLLKMEPKLRIYSEHESLTESEDSSWQWNLFNTIKSSRVIVHFLSQSYLESPECIEQYNISYCLNGSVKLSLAPLLLNESAALPNYMKAVQWINCHRYDPKKIWDAALAILQSNKPQLESLILEQTKTKTVNKDNTYDIFISYAHMNTNLMTSLYKRLDGSISVFVDTDQLKTGTQWQQSIYEALENSSVIVAFLSQDYFNSAVCLEELHLALASVASKTGTGKALILFCEDSFTIPEEYGFLETFPCKADGTNMNQYSSAIKSIVTNQKTVQNSIFARSWTSEHNCPNFDERLQMSRLGPVKCVQELKSLKINKNQVARAICSLSNIAILSSSTSKQYVGMAQKFYKELCGSAVQIHSQLDISPLEFNRLIEQSDLFLVFIDNKFLSSSENISFMNACILNCRLTPNKKQLVVILFMESSKCQHLYPFLLRTSFCVLDSCWSEFNSPIFENDVIDSTQKCVLASVAYSLMNKPDIAILKDKRAPVFKNIFK